MSARLFLLLLKCFPVLLSHHVCIFPVFTIKPEDTIWSIEPLSALMTIESRKLQGLSSCKIIIDQQRHCVYADANWKSQSLIKTWGSKYCHLNLNLNEGTRWSIEPLCALMAVESHKLKLSNQCLRQEQRIDANFILKLFDSAEKLFFSTIQRIFKKTGYTEGAQRLEKVIKQPQIH